MVSEDVRSFEADGLEWEKNAWCRKRRMWNKNQTQSTNNKLQNDAHLSQA